MKNKNVTVAACMEVVKELQPKGLTTCGFFYQKPTTMAEAGGAIGKLAKRFQYQPKQVTATPIYLNPGQTTELAENIDIPSG